jgi:hypothetical protein
MQAQTTLGDIGHLNFLLDDVTRFVREYRSIARDHVGLVVSAAIAISDGYRSGVAPNLTGT